MGPGDHDPFAAGGARGGPGAADALLADTFGVGTEQQPPWVSAAAIQAKAFTEALAYVERHQLPVSRAQAAGLTLLRILDGGRGVYVRIAEEAERMRMLGGPAQDFVSALEAIALASRPRVMSLGGGGRRR